MTAQSQITGTRVLVAPHTPRLTLRSLIGPIHGHYPASRITIRSIAMEVSEETGVPMAMICGRVRRTPVVEARWRVWSRARAQGFTLPQIGRATGHHHTSVLNGLRRMEAARKAEAHN